MFTLDAFFLDTLDIRTASNLGLRGSIVRLARRAVHG